MQDAGQLGVIHNRQVYVFASRYGPDISCWPAGVTLHLVRIMHFTDTYLPRRDGVITSLLTLTSALTDRGHSSVIAAPLGPVSLPSVPCGIADLRLARWPVTRGRDKLIGALAAHQPDLIHVHSPGPAGLLGVVAAQRFGVPLVQTYHTDLHAYASAYRVPEAALRALVKLYARHLGTSFPAGKAALDAGNELLLSPASAVIVPTPAVLERVCLPVDPQLLYLVPTGVAKREGPEGFRRRWGIPETGKVVLFVGRVNREKGVELLIPAFEKVLRAEPKARLVLIGAVYEPRWLKRLIKSDRIIVTGQQPPVEVAAAYREADVFAFPSLTDTQALVLQEAALAGVPSVLLDRVLHERGPLRQAAILATPETFADGLTGLLRHPETARALGEQARLNAARHTPEAFAEAIEHIYGTVLSPQPLAAARKG
jgi:1,2-diacylglycerol 3-alpha-glucosyltransferase